MTSVIPSGVTRQSLILLAVLGLVTACAHDQQPTSFVRAVPQEPPRIEATIEPAAFPSLPQKLKPLASSHANANQPSGLAAIKAAHEEALIASAPEGFINATQYFPYQPGALYELHAAPGFLSTIHLQPGETLLNYAAGDTSRWVIDNVETGDSTLLLVKPTRPELTTNLVISTDKRVYVVEATSHPQDTYNALIAWTYPFEEVSRQVAVVDGENERRDNTIVAGVPVDQLDFDYRINGDAPSWQPIRAFDDGAKVYIEFPGDLGTIEAPPLFLTEDDGSGQLVNYRVKQNYYVVDRLFGVAELRLADTVVRVAKSGQSSWSAWWNSLPKRPLRRDPDDHGERENESYDRGTHRGMDGHRS